MRVRFGRALQRAIFRQLLTVHSNGRPYPKRICNMIAAWIGRVRMDQNAQLAVVKHQPRHQRRKDVRGKGHLKHGPIVGTDLDVMPASKRDRKAFANPCAQALRFRARGLRIVIDMSMITCDLAQRSRGRTCWQIDHLYDVSRMHAPVAVHPMSAMQFW
jgi:hypothetical protein